MRKPDEPVEIGGLKLKNRLVRSATWEGLAAPDGDIDADTYEVYEELARGGVGCIITGFTSVAGNDRYFGGMMRLHDDALIAPYAKIQPDVPAAPRPAQAAHAPAARSLAVHAPAKGAPGTSRGMPAICRHAAWHAERPSMRLNR